MKCEYGIENCIFLGKAHDEECCFNGIWEHTYVCQECGYSQKATVYCMIKDKDGFYTVPEFKAKNCPKCKSEKSFV